MKTEINVYSFIFVLDYYHIEIGLLLFKPISVITLFFNPLRKSLKFFRKISFSFLLFPFVLGAFVIPVIAKDESKNMPANEQDLFLYRAIGATYICVARELDIDFDKAVAISAITYVNLLEGRHDSRIKAVGEKQFSRKELIFGANNQLIPAAVEYCPKKVPSKTKKEVNKFLKKLQSKNKKN